jgi:hypothetical protein
MDGLQEIAGRIDELSSTRFSSGGRITTYFTRYVIQCREHKFAFYERESGMGGRSPHSQKVLCLRVGDRIAVVVGKGLLDRDGDQVAYALRHSKTGIVYVSHAIMGALPPKARMTSMSYLNFQEHRRICRAASAVAVAFLGVMSWHCPAGTAVLLGSGAFWVIALEGFFYLYLKRWRSNRPSRTQARTFRVYAILGAGSPLCAGSNVEFV